MRLGLFAVAAAVLLAHPAAGPAADPPVVFQTQPVGKLLDDTRGLGAMLVGESAAKALNDSIKRTLGDKGFDGLDLDRPIVGYILIPADPEQSTFVVALPTTGEKAFLDLCERANKQKPKALKDGLHELPAPGPGAGMTAAVRFADGYAYLAAGKDPIPALDPKALVPMPKLFDPAERAQFAGKVHFDRLPKELRAKMAQGIEELKKQAAQLPINLGQAEANLLKGVPEELSKLATRYLDEIKDADTLTARASVEPGTGEAAFELGLVGKPGSQLAKDIASRKPSTNRFAGLVTKDAAVGFRVQMPLFAPEIRKAAAVGLGALATTAGNEAPPPIKKPLDELFKGLVRTVEAGEFDLAGAMRGPDKDGTFTVVGAVSFEDPKALEKELKDLVNATPEVKGITTFDAAKAGDVSVHEVKVGALLPPEPQRMFGANASVAVAFAPKGVYVAFGADAINAVKEAVAAKPGPAPALDVVIDPTRLAKVFTAAGGNANDVTEFFGPNAGPFTAGSVSVDGGTELKLRLMLNLKLFRAVFVSRASERPEPPAIEIKK